MEAGTAWWHSAGPAMSQHPFVSEQGDPDAAWKQELRDLPRDALYRIVHKNNPEVLARMRKTARFKRESIPKPNPTRDRLTSSRRVGGTPAQARTSPESHREGNCLRTLGVRERSAAAQRSLLEHHSRAAARSALAGSRRAPGHRPFTFQARLAKEFRCH